jgi:tetratricopeptide (TPR) repeat protein
MLKRPLTIGIGLMLLLTFVAYCNHFDNTFHFDDYHTILNNANIRSLNNIPRFFTDGSTSSVLPQNQAYRPVTVLTLALDYALGGDYYHAIFQADTFLWFLLQGLLMVYLFKKLFDYAAPSDFNAWIAVLITTFYMLHPANAETVNYIIARTDVQSTLLVVLGFVLYLYAPFWRKTYLYLLPVGVGILCKTTAVMFGPILFFYLLFFKEEVSLTAVFKSTEIKKLLHALIKTLPALVFCVFLFWVTEKMTPKSWEPGGTKPMQYLITQPFVMLHYFCEFFLPTGLSADTDWTLLPSVWDLRFFAGCIFMIAMLFIAISTSRRKETRPISFGIFWFFLALLPTSSVIPLAEVLNDHRMYFPFIGLMLSVGWAIRLLWAKYGSPARVRAMLTLLFALLACYAYGTITRNNVWHDEKSLWYDVTQKSPGNARGLMNYGLALYSEGDYPGAEHYLKAAEKLTPEYSVIYTNLGLVKEHEGDLTLAENYFRAGVKLGGNMPDPLCYYAAFLVKEWRYSEAVPQLQRAIKLSPLYLLPRTQLMEAYSMTSDWDKLGKFARQSLVYFPKNADIVNYITAAQEKKNELDVVADNIGRHPTAGQYDDLASANYDVMRYAQCIVVAQKAIKLNANDAAAYNNIGAADLKLHKYPAAEDALKQALKLQPGFALAQNNLNAVYAAEKTGATSDPFPLQAAYINLSLYYFNDTRYSECIAACDTALILQSGYDLAYNNICASNNKLGNYGAAITAAQKGLKYNPENQFLKNNLAQAQEGQHAGKK